VPLGHCADPNTPRLKTESSEKLGRPGNRGSPGRRGKPEGIPLPAAAIRHLDRYVAQYLPVTFQLTTRLCAQIHPAALTHAVNSYEAKALDILGNQEGQAEDGGCVFESIRRRFSNTKPSNINKHTVVAPTGFEPVFQP
jgi:hypothetical protein